MLTAAEVQRWSWKFLRVVVAVFLGAACFGAAMPHITETVSSQLPWKRRLRLVDPGALQPVRYATGKSTIVFDISDREITGTVHVRLPREDVVTIERDIAALATGTLWRHAIALYVPHVTVDTASLDYSNVFFTLPEGEPTGSMSLRLEAATLRESAVRIPMKIEPPVLVRGGGVDVTVLTRGMQVVAQGAAPVRQSPSAAVFTTADGHPLSFLLLRTPSSQKPQAARRSISEVVSTFDGDYLRVVQPLVTSLLYSVPFVLLFGLLQRSTPQRKSAAISLIVLFLGVGIGGAALDLYYGPLTPLQQRILDKCWDTLANPGGAAALGAAFVFCYWPLFTRRARLGEIRPAAKGTRAVLWILLLVSVVAAVATAVETCHDGASAPFLPLAAVTATLFALAAAAAEVAPAGRALLDAVLLAATAALFDLIDRFLDPSNAEKFVLVALLTVPLFFSLVRLLAPHWSRPAILGVAALAAAVTVIGPLPTYSLWWEANTLSVARELAPALRLVAALYLIGLLRELSRNGNWAVLEPEEREAGIILALTFFFMPSHQWLSIMVTFAFGWYLLQRWVFVPRNITPQADVPATIRDVIRLTEAEAALRMMKKDLRAKLAAGQLQFHQYESQVRRMEAFVDALRERVQPVGNNAPAAVLSSGTAMEPWTRAAIGAKYGLLFAVPWLALFLRDFYAGFAPERGYEWIAAIGTALQAMGQWPLLGFFFGYFYPHLRGETGLSKGLYLFVAVMTPAFSATALATPTSIAAWISFSFWTLQLFIHCMLLGFFAGDYETLRASGLGWRHLVDVHNLGALTAWGSSVVLAVGAAAITAATTQVGALVMQALQSVVPELTR